MILATLTRDAGLAIGAAFDDAQALGRALDTFLAGLRAEDVAKAAPLLTAARKASASRKAALSPLRRAVEAAVDLAPPDASRAPA